jgi:iron complex transport system substrate-binding protein
VYNFLRRTTPSGANDFWESGVVHPERILRDLQKIIAGEKTDLYYMTKLK